MEQLGGTIAQYCPLEDVISTLDVNSSGERQSSTVYSFVPFPDRLQTSQVCVMFVAICNYLPYVFCTYALHSCL